MHRATELYQISGFKAHSNGWFIKYDDKPTVKAIMATTSKLFRPSGTDSPIELVLGILPSGASYLLMTTEQMYEFTHDHKIPGRPRNPWRSTEFESLSPIYFNTLSELSAKVTTYKQRKPNKNQREEPQDSSQANRGYVKTGTQVVQYRSYFEHQRTLYRLLMRELEPAKVGLAQPPWLSCVRVISLVLGQWNVDNRSRGVRLQSPNLVEVGWTDALFPAFFEQLTGTTIHLKIKKTGMKNPGSTDARFSEIVEDDEAGLYTRLRNLFAHDANKSGIPLIVLVHDEDMARGILERAGVNVQSWSSGIAELLPLNQVGGNAKPRRRSRSRSPRRRGDGSTSYHRSSPVKLEDGEIRNATNYIPAILPTASIVDMQKLIRALMETDPGHTVPQSAKVLRMQTDTSTCAGDDSLLQLRMWKSMAEGLAIDEQRKERSSRPKPDHAKVLAPPQAAAPAGEIDPNDFDPNDVDDAGSAPAAPTGIPNMYDNFSDEDE